MRVLWWAWMAVSPDRSGTERSVGNGWNRAVAMKRGIPRIRRRQVRPRRLKLWRTRTQGFDSRKDAKAQRADALLCFCHKKAQKYLHCCRPVTGAYRRTTPVRIFPLISLCLFVANKDGFGESSRSADFEARQFHPSPAVDFAGRPKSHRIGRLVCRRE